MVTCALGAPNAKAGPCALPWVGGVMGGSGRRNFFPGSGLALGSAAGDAYLTVEMHN